MPVCLTFVGLKQPFAGFSARRRPRASLAPRKSPNACRALKVAPPWAPRFAHLFGRDHLGGAERILPLEGILEPALALRARAANGLTRGQRRRAALVHRAPGAPAHAGARGRSHD